jgi:hypothetical protein
MRAAHAGFVRRDLLDEVFLLPVGRKGEASLQWNETRNALQHAPQVRQGLFEPRVMITRESHCRRS